MAKPRLSNMGTLFEKRGDPMYTRREQFSIFGRSETENPDLDQFTRAKKVEPKAPFVDPKPIDTSGKRDFQREAAQIHLRFATTKPKSHKERDTRRDHAHAGHDYHTMKARRAAIERACFLFIKYKDGREEEPEIKDLKSARQRFDWKRKRAEENGIVLLELWENKTGNLVAKWEPRPIKKPSAKRES